MKRNRVYDGLFVFCCAAAVVCAFGSLYIPTLREPTVVLAMSAIFWRISTIKI